MLKGDGQRLLALAAAIAVLLSACSPHSGASPSANVLLVLVDALRADHLGAYGYDRPTSPNFDTLASRGTLFTHAHATTSWTNPSVESLFTGRFPEVLEPGAARFIDTGVATLAAVFQAQGYRTGAIIANPALPPDLGFAQGFEQYVAVSGWAHSLARVAKQPGDRVNAAALDWLRQAGARPWFLYVHYMDTHWPYEPPVDTARQFWRTPGVEVATAMQPLNQQIRERRTGLSPDQVRESIDLYDAAVAHFDAQLGTLLAALEASGALAHTWICITADHGEELGDHNGFLHARTLYEEVLHVPLLIVPPGRQPGRRIDSLRQISDVGRTLLDAVGLGQVRFPGQPLERKSADGPLLAALDATPLRATLHQWAVLRGADKLLVTPGGQKLLFNLSDDPGEHRDISADHTVLVAGLDQELAQASAPRSPGTTSAVSEAARERMRALGYDF